MNTLTPYSQAVLDFVAPTVDGYVAALKRLHRDGCRTLVLTPFDELAGAVVGAIAAAGLKFDAIVREHVQPGTQVPADVRPIAPGETTDAALLFLSDPQELSDALTTFLDRPMAIVAPITEHFYKRRSVFVVTIPKSGTHLLYQLLSAFDIRSGGMFRKFLSPQHWYFASGVSTHFPLGDFIRQAEIEGWARGGAGHPLFSTPVLFMYRNPLDIVVSESRWIGHADKTAMAYYLSGMTDDQRLLSLIEDDPVLHDIRYRVRLYAPWVRLPNTIPLSFEELVGPRGLGSAVEAMKTIWSLQLKLHIPGRPGSFANGAFNPDSPTFRAGRINAHQEAFKPTHWEAFRRLPQDFMAELGYHVDDPFEPGYVPRTVETFRHRQLTMSLGRSERAAETGTLATPVDDRQLLSYRGYYVGYVRRCFWAVPQATRGFDVVLDRPVPHLHSSLSMAELGRILDEDPLGGDGVWRTIDSPKPAHVFEIEPMPPELVLAFRGYNVVLFNRKYYAVPQALGRIDLQFDSIEGVKQILIANSLEEANRLIDNAYKEFLEFQARERADQ